MKILQIINPVIPFPPTTVGGTERIVQYLIEELVKEGHQVTVMGHDDSKLPEGVQFIPIGTYLNRKDTLKKVWQHLFLNKYDVIHNHGRLIYFVPKLWSSIRKVHTFHMAELETNSFLRFLKLRAKNLTYSPCGKWIQDKSKHLSGNWNFVNNGLPEKLYHYDKKPVLPDAPLIIICRMGPKKGVLDTIKLSKATNKKLIIAGKIGDYPQEIEWFNDHVLSECDGHQIKFIGEINDLEKNKLLNEAAALVIPTIDSEAFNTTMLEANACGCPVISYKRFCFDEYIVDGINGFKGQSFEDLIKAVNNLNQINRQDCRLFFERKYTAAHMAKNYLQLYKTKI